MGNETGFEHFQFQKITLKCFRISLYITAQEISTFENGPTILVLISNYFDVLIL